MDLHITPTHTPHCHPSLSSVKLITALLIEEKEEGSYKEILGHSLARLILPSEAILFAFFN